MSNHFGVYMSWRNVQMMNNLDLIDYLWLITALVNLLLLFKTFLLVHSHNSPCLSYAAMLCWLWLNPECFVPWIWKHYSNQSINNVG